MLGSKANSGMWILGIFQTFCFLKFDPVRRLESRNKPN